MSERKRYKCSLGDDTLEVCKERGVLTFKTIGPYAIPEGPTVDLSKPDAIDLGKRLLEHFDALPTADDVDSLEQYAIRCGWASATHREQSEIEAIIAKLRRLVGEEE